MSLLCQCLLFCVSIDEQLTKSNINNRMTYRNKIYENEFIAKKEL